MSRDKPSAGEVALGVLGVVSLVAEAVAAMFRWATLRRAPKPQVSAPPAAPPPEPPPAAGEDILEEGLEEARRCPGCGCALARNVGDIEEHAAGCPWFPL